MKVARIVDVLVGSTTPALVETESGERFVLKFVGAGHGARGLLTEFIGTHIARALGAPTPEAALLLLPSDMPWQVGADEFDDVVRRSAGWNLGLRFVEGARTVQPEDLATADPHVLSRIALADRFLQNVDRTARSPNILVDRQGVLHAIDHDACLFVDRALARRGPYSFSLPDGHVLDGLPLPQTAPSRPSLEAVALAPGDWFAAARLGREAVAQALSSYADAFCAAP